MVQGAGGLYRRSQAQESQSCKWFVHEPIRKGDSGCIGAETDKGAS